MPLIPPFRLIILRNLSTLISTVTPGNGYQNDLSHPTRRQLGRLTYGDDEDVPMVAINEPPLSIEPVKGAPRNTNRLGGWDLLIQGWAVSPKTAPVDATYVLSAEVQAVLASERNKVSGRPTGPNGPNFLGMGTAITEFNIGSPVVRPPDETSALACFYLILTLQIVEDMTKPFG